MPGSTRAVRPRQRVRVWTSRPVVATRSTAWTPNVSTGSPASCRRGLPAGQRSLVGSRPRWRHSGAERQAASAPAGAPPPPPPHPTPVMKRPPLRRRLVPPAPSISWPGRRRAWTPRRSSAARPANRTWDPARRRRRSSRGGRPTGRMSAARTPAWDSKPLPIRRCDGCALERSDHFDPLGPREPVASLALGDRPRRGGTNVGILVPKWTERGPALRPWPAPLRRHPLPRPTATCAATGRLVPW